MIQQMNNNKTAQEINFIIIKPNTNNVYLSMHTEKSECTFYLIV